MAQLKCSVFSLQSKLNTQIVLTLFNEFAFVFVFIMENAIRQNLTNDKNTFFFQDKGQSRVSSFQ